LANKDYQNNVTSART